MSSAAGTRLSAAEKASLYKHIVVELLEFGEGSPMDVAFEDEGFNEDPMQICNLDDDAINSLQVKLADGTMTRPPKVKTSKVRVFRNFVQYLIIINSLIK